YFAYVCVRLLYRNRCPEFSSAVRSLYRRRSDSTRHWVSEGGRERPPPKNCSYSIFSVRTSRSIWLSSSSMEAAIIVCEQFQRRGWASVRQCARSSLCRKRNHLYAPQLPACFWCVPMVQR